MHILNKNTGITGQDDEGPDQEDIEVTDDNEAFIRRLEIQRKLLNNFVNQTKAQMPQISKKKKLNNHSINNLTKPLQ
ncbi:MAG: hypothetical protein HOO86_01010 [Bacteroidales bacterium]|nr:hypothetical protein [Bacteroidales bacterium]